MHVPISYFLLPYFSQYFKFLAGQYLAPLTFVLYVYDLKNAQYLPNPIMLADDTDSFYTHENMHFPFSDMYKELTNINEWFVANKHSPEC